MRNPLQMLRRKRSKSHIVSPDGMRVVHLPSDWTVNLNGLRGSYGYIYRTQPNVRAVVDYYATQVASVKLKLFQRVAESKENPDGRHEANTHELTRLLNHPAPGVSTRTRLWFATAADTAVYDVAYWRKVRIGGRVRALVRIPPTALWPELDPSTQKILRYRIQTTQETVALNDLVVFSGYDPESAEGVISPLETLRRILSEEQSSGEHRQGLYRNSARKQGVVERPVEAPVWTLEQREAWRNDFESVTAGSVNAGRVALLEDGMTWKEAVWSPNEMEYLGARKLTRQECASAFRIDPRLVFATDEKADDDARNGFYVDRLVPALVRYQEEVDLQLLTEFEIDDGTFYTEFHIDAKLRGSLIQEAQYLSMATGRAWLLTNEARKRHNLPPVETGEGLVTPLNVLVGGQASPRSPIETPGPTAAPGETPGEGKTYVVAMTEKELERVRLLFSTNGHTDQPSPPAEKTAEQLQREAELRRQVHEAVAKHLERQKRTVLNMLGAARKAGTADIETIWVDDERWNRELARDLGAFMSAERSDELAAAVNQRTRVQVQAQLPDGDVAGAFVWEAS